MNSDEKPVEDYLSDGWVIVGYSVCMMAAGATSHHILLQKEASLATCTILNPGPKEIARSVQILAPNPTLPARKGFFG